MAALQRIPAIFAFSHDSIALGQDGPTHQPVEQLDGLRAMPGLTVFRPADAIETQSVWDYALNKNHGPVVIAMSRQALPVLEGSLKYAKECVKRGGYCITVWCKQFRWDNNCNGFRSKYFNRGSNQIEKAKYQCRSSFHAKY